MKLFNQSIEAMCGKLGEFVTSKTVVGEPITFGNVIVVPLVEVVFGMGAGSGGSGDKDNGGGALGGKISPTAALVIVNDTVQLVNVKNQESVNKLIDLVPGIMSKLGAVFAKDKPEDR